MGEGRGTIFRSGIGRDGGGTIYRSGIGRDWEGEGYYISVWYRKV